MRVGRGLERRVEMASDGTPGGPTSDNTGPADGAGSGPTDRAGSSADGTGSSADEAGSSADEAGGGPILVLRHAAKSFGAVQALVDGSIELYPGEAHALVGENGAGKSTLVKILAGVYQPDAGALLVDGQEVTLHGPAAARAAGIVLLGPPFVFTSANINQFNF